MGEVWSGLIWCSATVAAQTATPALALLIRCGRLERGGHDACIPVDSAGASPSILAVALPDRSGGQGHGVTPSDGGRWARAWKALGGYAYLSELKDRSQDA
jgi:hypothetical protein